MLSGDCVELFTAIYLPVFKVFGNEGTALFFGITTVLTISGAIHIAGSFKHFQ